MELKLRNYQIATVNKPNTTLKNLSVILTIRNVCGLVVIESDQMVAVLLPLR